MIYARVGKRMFVRCGRKDLAGRQMCSVRIGTVVDLGGVRRFLLDRGWVSPEEDARYRDLTSYTLNTYNLGLTQLPQKTEDSHVEKAHSPSPLDGEGVGR